jgi:hypothetical protein
MALVADEPPPELEKKLDIGGLGFQLTDGKKRQFKISPATADRIVKNMKMRGYFTGDWDIDKVSPASPATKYVFTFEPPGAKDKPQIFRLEYKNYDLHAVIDHAELEASRLPDEAGMSVYDLANKRMRKFVLAVENSRGGYAMKAQPVPAGAPAGPVAAGAPPPGPPAAAEDSVLANLMGKMGVREGGRRRTKKRKSLRRRLSKKKRFT